MSEVARFSFKNESLPSRGKLDRRAVVGLWVLGLLLTGYLYYLYLHHLTHNRSSVAASMAAAASAAKPSLPAVAPKPVAQTGPINSTNSIPTKPAQASLSDSLMAVLAPSAKGETIQPDFQSLKDKSAAIPVARQPLKVQPPVLHDEPPLTDGQKLLLAATNGFANVINFAFKNPDIFGFAPNERIQDAALGEALPVYTIAASDRENYQEGQPVKSLLQATNEWIFPVTLNHRVRFMVPVRRIDDEYVVQPCSRSLAIVYERILERWPAREGYHPQLVVNANLPHYYFTIPELPDQNLTDTSAMFEFNPTLSPASVILASWQ